MSKQQTLASFFKPKKRPQADRVLDQPPPLKKPAIDVSDRSVQSVIANIPDDQKAKHHDKAVEKLAVVNKPQCEEFVPAKLTPLQQQIVDIKLQYPTTILAFEVGYKYNFYAQDAQIASSLLKVVLIPGQPVIDQSGQRDGRYSKFASCSVPTHRISIHIRRLTEAGYKVGIVSQSETAALKAASANKSGPFSRHVSQIFTRASYIDDPITGYNDALTDKDHDSFIMCLLEIASGDSDNKLAFSLVAVQPATGHVSYDTFADSAMRVELEARLKIFMPDEVLLLGDISLNTQKLLKHVLGGTVRVETADCPSLLSATDNMIAFYKSLANSPETALQLFDSLPESVKICLSAVKSHIAQYSLERALLAIEYFQFFTSKSYMTLSGTTLSALDIFTSSGTDTPKGSLFWALNNTNTQFGRRLLRQWIARPLLDPEALNDRRQAVNEILFYPSHAFERIRQLLKGFPDIEKGLSRIRYKKCSCKELSFIIYQMRKAAGLFTDLKNNSNDHAIPNYGFKSAKINQAIHSISIARAPLSELMTHYNADAGKADNLSSFFIDRDEYRGLYDLKSDLKKIYSELDYQITEIRDIINKDDIAFCSVGGIEYQVEISHRYLSKVPASWIKMSGTKQFSRFHTPKVNELLNKRDQLVETIELESKKYLWSFMDRIIEYFVFLRGLIDALALFDCLFSMAEIAKRPQYIEPQFTSEQCLDIKGGRHPVLEQLLENEYVPNDTELSSTGTRAMIITGPNMGGKSSYVRQTALLCIMAQVGFYVPARSAKLGYFDAVLVRMGASDLIMQGQSTFMVELNECKEIMRSATTRSLVILDEIGRGTSTFDGVSIAWAILDYFAFDVNCLFFFITHYPQLAKFEDEHRVVVQNYHLTYFEHEEANRIVFLYKVVRGAAKKSYGLNVARMAHIPEDVVLEAEREAAMMQFNTPMKLARHNAELLKKVLAKGSSSTSKSDILELFTESSVSQIHNNI
ncbi:hypothetical protein CANCADRAFT_31913 [Tortispora caseinolytica NRRL Y-17796]|uniref:DNA mismatch repair protein MSH3 n=1 Tax=Tortispora caseinolytica NRRL Y-17796 TaxID=767744 RepID=A0A1E4THF9_9ASCO|nr:hypothetical protein CANCADRAFT_31913 [Tortispora caseinolytica NRRL Y-17796]